MMPPKLQDSMQKSQARNQTHQEKPARSNVFTAICSALELGPEQIQTLQSDNINSGDFKVRIDDLYRIYLQICERNSITPAYIKTEQGGYMSQDRLSELKENAPTDIQVIRY